MAPSAELTTTFEQIAGRALAPGRYFPRKDGSLREKCEDGQVVVHPADSELAKAAQALWAALDAEWRAPRPATRVDANMNDEIALMAECAEHTARQRGDHDEAEKQTTQARRRKRRAWMIRRHLNAQLRPSTQPAELRPARTSTRARDRRDRRSSSPSRAGPSDDEGPSDEPPQAGRLCENLDCTRGPDAGRADISHLGTDAYYCDNGGACKQAAYRDRLTHAAAERRFGTTTWKVSCNHPRAHGQFAPDGVCFACGRPRGQVTIDWETRNGPKEHRSFVSAPAPKRKTPRLGDGTRKLVFTDEHGELKRLTDEEVVAA